MLSADFSFASSLERTRFHMNTESDYHLNLLTCLLNQITFLDSQVLQNSGSLSDYLKDPKTDDVSDAQIQRFKFIKDDKCLNTFSGNALILFLARFSSDS